MPGIHHYLSLVLSLILFLNMAATETTGQPIQLLNRQDQAEPDRPTRILGELPELTNPHPMVINDGNLLILDDYFIHVYSLESLELVNRFGGRGTLAGQFQYPGRVYTFPDGIIGTDFLKTVWFSPDGTVQKHIEYSVFADFDTNQEMVLLPVGDNYLRVTSDHDLMERSVTLVGADYQIIDVLETGPYFWNKPGTRAPAVAPRVQVTCEGDRIYISNSALGFLIEVFDTTGEPLLSIDLNHEIEPVLFSEDDWAAFTDGLHKQYPSLPVDQIELMFAPPDYFPALHQFTVSNGGKLYELAQNAWTGIWELYVTDLQ